MQRLLFFLALFLTAAAALMLQIIQVRIFSVMTWYQLAFFAISIGMFGLTVGAVLVYLRPQRFAEIYLSYNLSYFGWLFALSIVLSLLCQTTLVLVPPMSLSSLWVWVELTIAIALPFICAGVVVSLALTRSPYSIGQLYAVDMIGASLGCLLVVLLLNHVDGPTAMLWTAVIAAVAALLFGYTRVGNSPAQRFRFNVVLQMQWPILAALVLLTLMNGEMPFGIQPLMSKGSVEFPSSYASTQWNSFSRISLTHEQYKPGFLWGGSPLFDGQRIRQQYLEIDGDAGSPLYKFKNDLSNMNFLKNDVTNMAYFLPNRPRVAVIGLGGGRDVLSAILLGHRNVTAVEINPIFVKLFASRLDALPGVKLVVDEGRSWFARTTQHFNIIQMSLIDTWAATGAGAFTLSENGLYTLQAWKLFYTKLADDGVFSVSRWVSPTRHGEAGRLLSLSMAVLLDQGVEQPRQHIMMIGQKRIGTLLLSKKPFTANDIKVLKQKAADYKHTVLVSPDQPSSIALYRHILSAHSMAELNQFNNLGGLDVRPPTDDRPFFFNLLPFDGLLRYLVNGIDKSTGDAGVLVGNIKAMKTLAVLFAISLAFVVAMIVMPLRHAAKEIGRQFVLAGTTYFLLIGFGFMLIEIALLQRMGVFLGHPVYALSILLFTIIFSTGIGSLLSDVVLLNTRLKQVAWGMLLTVLLMLLACYQPRLLAAYASGDLATRIIVCVLSILPAGLLMGFGFPVGMQMISKVNRKPMPWFWGINGAAGVLASEIALALSLILGIQFTIIIGALCYFALIPVMIFLHKQA